METESTQTKLDTRGTVAVPTGRILIADDEERNRRLLRDLLKRNGHTVHEAIDGESALAKVREVLPDVVLLDVMMPKIDGFDVCRQLRQAPETATIPVLMVTVLKEREDRLRGIEAGADDFLSKPIDVDEVALKVRNAIRMKRLHDRVREDLNKLQELEQLRDNLTHMIIHDMRSPLMAIMGGIQILGDKVAETDEDRRFVNMASSAASELNEMVKSLLDVSRLESGEMPVNLGEYDLKAVAQAAVASNEAGAEFGGVRVDVSGEAAPARFDKELIHRVFSNLIGNAIKFSPEGGAIEIRVRTADSKARAEVQDSGPGIPERYREKIFEKFGQIEARRDKEKHSTGLGLTFCKLAVEAHGGKIGVESPAIRQVAEDAGRGSIFWFELPLGAVDSQ